MAENLKKYLELKLPKIPARTVPFHSIYLDSDGDIRCCTYFQALHVVEFLEALGLETHAVQLPMSQDAKVRFGKKPITKKDTPVVETKKRGRPAKTVSVSDSSDSSGDVENVEESES